MKKSVRKMVLNMETVRSLACAELEQAAGGAVQTERFSACQTNCHASICICEPPPTRAC
jgi:hypothetical protein